MRFGVLTILLAAVLIILVGLLVSVNGQVEIVKKHTCEKGFYGVWAKDRFYCVPKKKVKKRTREKIKTRPTNAQPIIIDPELLRPEENHDTLPLWNPLNLTRTKLNFI